MWSSEPRRLGVEVSGWEGRSCGGVPSLCRRSRLLSPEPPDIGCLHVRTSLVEFDLGPRGGSEGRGLPRFVLWVRPLTLQRAFGAPALNYTELSLPSLALQVNARDAAAANGRRLARACRTARTRSDPLRAQSWSCRQGGAAALHEILLSPGRSISRR